MAINEFSSNDEVGRNEYRRERKSKESGGNRI